VGFRRLFLVLKKLSPKLESFFFFSFPPFHIPGLVLSLASGFPFFPPLFFPTGGTTEPLPKYGSTFLFFLFSPPSFSFQARLSGFDPHLSPPQENQKGQFRIFFFMAVWENRVPPHRWIFLFFPVDARFSSPQTLRDSPFLKRMVLSPPRPMSST